MRNEPLAIIQHGGPGRSDRSAFRPAASSNASAADRPALAAAARAACNAMAVFKLGVVSALGATLRGFLGARLHLAGLGRRLCPAPPRLKAPRPAIASKYRALPAGYQLQAGVDHAAGIAGVKQLEPAGPMYLQTSPKINSCAERSQGKASRGTTGRIAPPNTRPGPAALQSSAPCRRPSRLARSATSRRSGKDSQARGQARGANSWHGGLGGVRMIPRNPRSGAAEFVDAKIAGMNRGCRGIAARNDFDSSAASRHLERKASGISSTALRMASTFSRSWPLAADLHGHNGGNRGQVIKVHYKQAGPGQVKVGLGLVSQSALPIQEVAVRNVAGVLRPSAPGSRAAA